MSSTHTTYNRLQPLSHSIFGSSTCAASFTSLFSHLFLPLKLCPNRGRQPSHSPNRWHFLSTSVSLTPALRCSLISKATAPRSFLSSPPAMCTTAPAIQVSMHLPRRFATHPTPQTPR